MEVFLLIPMLIAALGPVVFLLSFWKSRDSADERWRILGASLLSAAVVVSYVLLTDEDTIVVDSDGSTHVWIALVRSFVTPVRFYGKQLGMIEESLARLREKHPGVQYVSEMAAQRKEIRRQIDEATKAYGTQRQSTLHLTPTTDEQVAALSRLVRQLKAQLQNIEEQLRDEAMAKYLDEEHARDIRNLELKRDAVRLRLEQAKS